MNNTNKIPENNTPCPGCGGSGQTAYFGGESRFMFTWEDCPDCHGTGIVLDEPSFPDQSAETANTLHKKRPKLS